MKIKIRARQAVEIDQHEIKKIAESYLVERFGICNSRDYYHKVEKGNLVLVEEHSAGLHSHETEKIVRKATELDKAVVTVLRELDRS